MNLTSLLTALTLAAAADAKLGGAPSFAEQVSFLEAHCEGCQPDYCYPKYEDPDYGCYKDGYPKCCSKSKGNCPNDEKNKPGCECEPGTCSGGGGEEDKSKRCARGDGTCKGVLFCKTQEGACGGEGRCQDMTVSCDRSYKEVCGCNGATYENECAAFSVGVSVDYEGACGATPAPTPYSTSHEWFPDAGMCDESCTKNKHCQNGGYNPCGECGDIPGTIMYRRCYQPADETKEQ